MKCPRCGNLEDKVLESRHNCKGTSIRRRRECVSCNYRFTSYERIEETPLMIIKNERQKEPFSLEKLERGIQKALQARPIADNTIEEMVNDIEDEIMIRGRNSHEFSSDEIGKMVLERLYKLDRVAYLRFASVYKKFSEVDEFITEIEKFK